MERSIKIAISFIRYQYAPHLLMSLAFILLSGQVVSFQNLNDSQCAKVLEVYAVFLGVLLLVPLFMPEQNEKIWRLERSKRTAMYQLYLERVLIALFMMCMAVFCYLVFLKNGNSSFAAGRLFLGAVSEMTFLGSIGFCVSGITNQVVLGYMASVMYYAVNIGKAGIFGKLALFQMMKNIYDFWWAMLLAAMILLAVGMTVRERRTR